MTLAGIKFWTVALVVSLAAVATGPAKAGPNYKAVPFSQLLDWDADDHGSALLAFLDSCEDISVPEWKPLCVFAATKPNARTFFETFFTPVIVRPDRKALFTGYFEPQLNGSLYKMGPYQYPVHKKPKNLEPKDPNLTRAAIGAGALVHKGLEIAYVDDPVELYYLHIQGSGRIKLTNGNIIRIGYAGENGRVYRSAAGELVRQGEISAGNASIEGIRSWVRKNPIKGHNAMQRLMVAQDVGSAIKGPQRADIFFGTGAFAGKLAGQTKDSGRMVVLLPHKIAQRLAPEG